MDKKEVLDRLKGVYCRLRASSIQGVGVFAIRDIPAGINPFKVCKQEKWFKFHVSELEELDKAVMEMVDDFCVIEEDGTVLIPENALSGMDISFYLNNSENPNMKTIDEGFTFVTLRPIKKGEELTVAYETYDYKFKKPAKQAVLQSKTAKQK